MVKCGIALYKPMSILINLVLQYFSSTSPWVQLLLNLSNTKNSSHATVKTSKNAQKHYVRNEEESRRNKNMQPKTMQFQHVCTHLICGLTYNIFKSLQIFRKTNMPAYRQFYAFLPCTQNPKRQSSCAGTSNNESNCGIQFYDFSHE